MDLLDQASHGSQSGQFSTSHLNTGKCKLGIVIGKSSSQYNNLCIVQDDVFLSSHKTREGRKLRRIDSKLSRRRDSSADTCKDIDDIEDLELDDEQEDIDTNEDIEEECDDKRLRGFTISPDLAYCSMEGCG